MRFRVISIVLCLLFTAPAFAEEKLIFAIDIIRHGDRTPTVELPKNPYTWPLGLGELTANGMNQEFQNGVHFRELYVDQYHLLPAHYQAQTMYVRSTDVNRTLMSAESVLLGLYPLGTGPDLFGSNDPALPEDYQPIPIHTIPTTQDSLLMYHDKDGRYEKMLQQYVYNRQDWIEKTKEFARKFKQWSELTGLNIVNLNDIDWLGDDLFIRQLYHVDLPQGMTKATADEIIALSHFVFVTKYKPYAMGKFTSLELLNSIGHYLQQAAEDVTSLKYVLDSAHDSTILGAMSAMQVPLDVPPHYASDLKFLLFENNKQYTVKISLNGQPVLLPACHGKDCSLEEFLNFVKKQ